MGLLMIPTVFHIHVDNNTFTFEGTLPNGVLLVEHLLEKIQNESELSEDFWENEEFTVTGHSNGDIEIKDLNFRSLERIDGNHIVNYI